MFFILSKILYFIIQPVVWLVFFTARALWVKNPYKRRKILRGLLWGILILTNPFISNRVFHAWEYPVVPIKSLNKTYEIGIVLGGFTEGDTYAQDRLNFGYAANRLTDALILYKQGIVKKLLLSGGDGRLTGTEINESESTKDYLLSIGIPETDILIENKSRNTHENAVFTMDFLKKNGMDKAPCLVITSASHMRRAIKCFEKAGVNCLPFPAHFVAERLDYSMSTTLLPDKLAFAKWEAFLKEWIGYGVYWLQGYI